MDEKQRYVANRDIVDRQEGDEGELLLYNPVTGRIKVLNRTGALLWQECGEPRSRSELVEHLQQRYRAVKAEVLGSDVDRFLDDMLSLELFQVVAE